MSVARLSPLLLPVPVPVPTPVPVSGERPAEPGMGTRANTARVLCAALGEAAEGFAAEAGGAATGLCLPLAVLWSRILKFDAADPHWPDRDRFILSHEAATPLLQALLHLTGHADPEARDPWAESRLASGAPGGQAIAMAAGMALAERVLAARFGKSLVDHRVWAACEAAELTQGVTQEAAAIAGHFRLDRLVLLADAGAGSAAGAAPGAAPGGLPAEDARARFGAQGWAVKSVAADDPDAIESGLSFALRSRKPTLLWCLPGSGPHPPAGRGSANALAAWRRVGARGVAARRAWLKRITRHPQRAEFERVHAGRLPDGMHEAFAALRVQGAGGAPAGTLCRLIERLGQASPELLCGRPQQGEAACCVQPGQYGGRTIAFGRRPLGAAACTNGIALHGGTLPLSAGPLSDLAEQLPALRLAGLLGRRSVHLATDCARTPMELLAWLRAIPALVLFRPGGAIETAECLELAIRRTDGPSLVILDDDRAAAQRAEPGANLSARGGYLLAEAGGERRATLIAGGPAVRVALAARLALAAGGIGTAVVSLPCWSLFAQQDDAYRRAVLGAAPRFGLEASCRDGWDRWLNEAGGVIPLDGGGPEGSAEHVVQSVRRRLLPLPA